MSRVFSVWAVLALSLLAVAMWLRQTLAVREGLDVMIAFQVLLGIGIIAGIVLLIRTGYARRKNAIRPKRFEAVQQLRRLFSAVWS